MEIPLAVNMRHIRAFLAIAQQGSFTRAAEHLALSQPALTICIRQLEACLGLSMFNRTTRRVSLTFAGREFLPTARRLLSEFEAALSNMQAHADSQRGRVSVAALPSVAAEWLPPTVSHFARTYPQVSIEITVEDSPGIYRRVRENDVNFGFAGQLKPAPDLAVRKLQAEEIGLVCRPDHPLANLRSPLRWRDLEGCNFLDSGNDDCVRTVLAQFPNLTQTLTSAQYRTNKAAILVAMIEEGIGVTAMPLMAVPREYRTILTFRPLREPAVDRSVYLVQRRNHTLSAAENRFIETALAVVDRLGNSRPKGPPHRKPASAAIMSKSSRGGAARPRARITR
jgi:DNA-binding transcriptional LysR family regulator